MSATRRTAAPSDRTVKPSAKHGAATPKKKVAAPKAVAPKAAPAPKTKAERAARALALFETLRAAHPDAHCELDHQGAFQLIVATVLSAQTTDKLVNKATPALFARYPDAPALAAASPEDVAQLLKSGGLGMYNQKGKNIVGLARALVASHGGAVPRDIDALVKLPGVGQDRERRPRRHVGHAGRRSRRHARAAPVAAPRVHERDEARDHRARSRRAVPA